MASTSVSTKTVVVADDTAFVRDRFRTAVENAGHKAIIVKSAAELLARIRADLEQIDLIVVDLRLPHAPGVDLIRSIRKLDEGRLPVLIFSGTIANADEILVLHHGQVRERGTHRELLAQRGLYERLFRLQAGIARDTLQATL